MHQVLADHTVLPSLSKETRFFDTHFHRGLEWYRAHFPHRCGERRVGEVAPTYFASSAARERISQVVPHAKVVCIFRNPVERVLSLYRVKCAYGMIPWTLEEAMVKDAELVESGKYATNLRAWQQTLGSDQVLATIYDDMCNKPQEYLDSLADFIDIPRVTLRQSQGMPIHSSESMTYPRNYKRTRNATVFADWLKARRLDLLVAAVRRSPVRKVFLGGGPAFAALSTEIACRVCETFRPEVEELESILNRDLSAWKYFGRNKRSSQPSFNDVHAA